MRALIAGMLCALAAAPAAAEVRLTGPETGGTYQLQVMTWWDIPFRSVIRQRYDFSCGSAALATLLTYHYGAPTSEAMPFRAMWEKGDREAIRKVGFSRSEERRVGKGGVRTCNSRGWRYHSKKKK